MMTMIGSEEFKEYAQAMDGLRRLVESMPREDAAAAVWDFAEWYGIPLNDASILLGVTSTAERVRDIIHGMPETAVTFYGEIADVVGSSPLAVSRIITAKAAGNPLWIPPAEAARILPRPEGRRLIVNDLEFKSEVPGIDRRSRALDLTPIPYERLEHDRIEVLTDLVLYSPDLRELD